MRERIGEWLDAASQSNGALRASQYFASLAPRERMALKILAAFLGPVVLIFAIMLPAWGFMQTSLNDYQQALEDNRWIDANKQSALQFSSTGRTPGQSLFGLANTTSKGFQIGFKRYEPVGENALSLWMEGVSFNNLILWLERLEKRHGVRVKEISVERLDIEGLVNVRLVLQG